MSQQITVVENEFRMLKPCYSYKGYWIVGALVGIPDAPLYSMNVMYQNQIHKAFDQIKKKIQKDHPGIEESLGSYRLPRPKWR